MTRLILPAAIFRGGNTVPEWSSWECIADIEGMPILWKYEDGINDPIYTLFAQDHQRTDMLGDYGEHKTVVLTPFVAHEKLSPEKWLREYGFQPAEYDLGWEVPQP